MHIVPAGRGDEIRPLQARELADSQPDLDAIQVR